MISAQNGWWLAQTGLSPAAWNMAFDETLLESAGRLEHPLLRFYGWTEPAATFGYFQKYSEVEALTSLRPLIRRPTGGGIVPHDADWTYSLVFPPGHSWHGLSATESYCALHQWIQRAFEKLACALTLAPASRKEAPGQCFVGHEKFDLVLGAAKVAGAAQRRNRLGLLIQGSVQPPAGLAKADWQKALCDVAHQEQGANWQAWEPPGWFSERVDELVRQKYGTDRYNRKR